MSTSICDHIILTIPTQCHCREDITTVYTALCGVGSLGYIVYCYLVSFFFYSHFHLVKIFNQCGCYNRPFVLKGYHVKSRLITPAAVSCSMRLWGSRPRTAAPLETTRWASNALSSSVHIITSARPERVWNTIPHWCSLCLEPLNDWDNHRGKRDHICLEMFYDTLVNTERQWDPESIWHEVQSNVLACRLGSDEDASAESVLRHMLMPREARAFYPFFNAFDNDDPAQRRRELNSCLTYLQRIGVLHIDTTNLQQASFYGGVVMFKELFTPLAQIFPKADAKEVSALTQMVYATYNNETVFDLCQMETLIPEALLRERLPLTPPTGDGDFDANGGDDAALLTGDAVAEEAGSVPYYLKGVFFRAVLGSLRWALEPDTIAPPPGLGMDEETHGVVCVLAAYAARLLISELIFYKISEYVVRVEGVFRREGLKEAAASRLEKQREFDKLRNTNNSYRVVPTNSCWGMCQYCGGEKHVFNVCGDQAFQRAGKWAKKPYQYTNGAQTSDVVQNISFGIDVCLFMHYFVITIVSSFRHGKVRLAKWYISLSQKDKGKIIKEVSQSILRRPSRFAHILTIQGRKYICRKYASLFFVACVNDSDNELNTFEIIHLFVETLDRYFGSVCELDVIFNFHRVYFILDEVLLAGELQESSKLKILRQIQTHDQAAEKSEENMRGSLSVVFLPKSRPESFNPILRMLSNQSIFLALGGRASILPQDIRRPAKRGDPNWQGAGLRQDMGHGPPPPPSSFAFGQGSTTRVSPPGFPHQGLPGGAWAPTSPLPPGGLLGVHFRAVDGLAVEAARRASFRLRCLVRAGRRWWQLGSGGVRLLGTGRRGGTSSLMFSSHRILWAILWEW
eukprot:gene743-391_t